MNIGIEPTTACNLRCPECPSGLRSFTRPTGNISVSTFEKVIDQIKNHTMYLTFYFQGEPYIHPKFLEMVTKASKAGIYTSTSTNAHFLSDTMAKKTVESGLDRIIISIDGTTQEVYEQYRREGSLEKVIQGAQNIVKWKKKLNSNTPYILFQYLVVKPNEHQIKEAKDLASEIGVDQISFKTAQIYDYEHGHELIPENENYSRYKKVGEKYQLKNKLLNQCWKMWAGCLMTWDGDIIPCCFDKDAKHKMGNILTHSFDVIWKNKTYNSFRSKLLTSRKEIDICTNCSEGTKVWSD